MGFGGAKNRQQTRVAAVVKMGKIEATEARPEAIIRALNGLYIVPYVRG
jgi:hypothetical protein